MTQARSTALIAFLTGAVGVILPWQAEAHCGNWFNCANPLPGIVHVLNDGVHAVGKTLSHTQFGSNASPLRGSAPTGMPTTANAETDDGTDDGTTGTTGLDAPSTADFPAPIAPGDLMTNLFYDDLVKTAGKFNPPPAPPEGPQFENRSEPFTGCSDMEDCLSPGETNRANDLPLEWELKEMDPKVHPNSEGYMPPWMD